MTFYVSEALAKIRQKQIDEITKQKEVESSNERKKMEVVSRPDTKDPNKKRKTHGNHMKVHEEKKVKKQKLPNAAVKFADKSDETDSGGVMNEAEDFEWTLKSIRKAFKTKQHPVTGKKLTRKDASDLKTKAIELASKPKEKKVEKTSEVKDEPQRSMTDRRGVAGFAAEVNRLAATKFGLPNHKRSEFGSTVTAMINNKNKTMMKHLGNDDKKAAFDHVMDHIQQKKTKQNKFNLR